MRASLNFSARVAKSSIYYCENVSTVVGSIYINTITILPYRIFSKTISHPLLAFIDQQLTLVLEPSKYAADTTFFPGISITVRTISGLHLYKIVMVTGIKALRKFMSILIACQRNINFN